MTSKRIVERPIIFSAPMVRAILAGQKTQTRRVVRPEPQAGVRYSPGGGAVEDGHGRAIRPRYGAPGDRLWVREAFRMRADQDQVPPSRDWWKAGAWYEADGDCAPSGCGGGAGRLRPSIFMPRWASRLTLEITSVRVQRLQEISEEDAQAEGVLSRTWDQDGLCLSREHQHLDAINAFACLWDEINGKRAPWASNPWVWAITFRRSGESER